MDCGVRLDTVVCQLIFLPCHLPPLVYEPLFVHLRVEAPGGRRVQVVPAHVAPSVQLLLLFVEVFQALVVVYFWSI